jgi:hypothetical protein
VSEFRVKRKDIAFLKFIVEAYEGVAVLSTEDPSEGRISARVAPGREPEWKEILKSLEGRVRIQPLPAMEDRTSRR